MSESIKKQPEKSLTNDIEEKLKEARKRAKMRAKKAVGMDRKLKPDVGPVKTGTTALVLSGGAARGAYEMGVWQALRELGIKIDIVCGTSIGAMNSYIIAQNRFEDAVNMWVQLNTEEVFDFDNIIENRGVTFTGITDMLRRDFPETDVRNSDIEFGICTVKITDGEKLDLTSAKPLYMWTKDIPEGEMLDYVLASCSCYPIVKPYEINGEKFLDGGFYDYIPIRMALEKGAEQIIAVNLEAVGYVQEEDVEIAEDRLTMITPSWELGSFVVFDPSNTRRIMRIGYLDTMKAFSVFDGRKYTFIKGSTDNRMLASAERAGKIFDLDPGIIYSKESFCDAISRKIETYRQVERGKRKYIEKEFNKLAASNFKWKNIKESAAETGDLSMEMAFLKACSILANPKSSDLLKAGCRRALGNDYGAAQWVIKNKLI